MIRDLVLVVIGNAAYDISKATLKKLFTPSTVGKTIALTADDFPHLPGAEQALTRWCQSEDFITQLEAIHAGRITAVCADDALIRSFVANGYFYNDDETMASAQSVLVSFFTHLKREIFHTPDAPYMAEMRAGERHAEVTSKIERSTSLVESYLDDISNPQPKTWLPKVDNTHENRFVYAAERVSFLGRAEELKALQNFVNSQFKFKWWLVVGGAGAGKSRLALELAHRVSEQWYIGFLRSGVEFGWDKWRPTQPTVLIVDYAESAATLLNALIIDLQTRENLQHPVRILLLVRRAEEQWKDLLFGTGTDRALVSSAKYGDELKIEGLSDDDLWTIITSFYLTDKPTLHKARTLELLLRIDPQRRPLFAAFTADALAHGRDLRQWDQEALVNDVLKRNEDKYWKASGVNEKDKNLLALTTMLGSFPLGALPELDMQLFPMPIEYHPTRYRAVSGDDSTEHVSPIVPDILGELFVLEHLKPRHAADTGRVEKLKETAWRFFPPGMFSFLMRSVMDFPKHPTVPLIDAVTEQNKTARALWGVYVVDQVKTHCENGNHLHARDIYQALSKLAAAFPDEMDLRDSQAVTAYNMVLNYSDVLHNLAEARFFYDEIVKLAAAHPEEPLLSYRQARAARNLVVDHFNRGSFNIARSIYRELSLLVRKFSGFDSIAEQLSKTAYFLILREDLQRSWQPYQTMISLNTKIRDKLIRTECLKGFIEAANILALRFEESGDSARAESIRNDAKRFSGSMA